ncbi:MAG: imidazole glycerol phosphate synthase subunit HisH [Bacteroidaceae bacterium]|nr:imidazole glycerol phosphate synthase subunit HisH [Bacteroidaceae bacterium]MBR1901646.1 imidazole glycerol phosphate synthase subunit HisH [Bacteroidaceae bacterium]
MKVAVVKYNAGNIYSVIHALQRLGVTPVLTDNPEELQKADKVLFPGQGEASNAMRYLKEHNLDKVIRDLKNPILGICIGQQLMCRHSEEGDTDCLGIFDVDVLRFQPQKHEDKVPHMGWNQLSFAQNEKLKEKREKLSLVESGLFKGFSEGEFVYFVHSFYVPVCENTIAITDYILPYSAALHKDNFYATQFHPEKSGSVGERIIKNFLEL